MPKRPPQPPPANDWLFSCPPGTPTRGVVTRLGAERLALTEVSASHWQETWRMANDLLDAWGLPPQYHFARGRVSWDGLRDWLFERPVGSLGNTEGELLLIRHCLPDATSTLAFLLSILQAGKDEMQRLLDTKPHMAKTERVLVVLEGWQAPTLEAHVNRRYAWSVNALP